MADVYKQPATNLIMLMSNLVLLTTSGGGISVTDNFDAYSVGALAGQGNWRTCFNTISVSGTTGNNYIYSNTDAGETCVKRSEAFTGNHSSQLTIRTAQVDTYIGPAVRCSGSGATACYYAMYGSSDGSGAFGIGIIRSGVWNDFLSSWANGLVDGDILKLTISGNTLRAYKNGSLASGMGTAVIGGFSGTGGDYVIDPTFMEPYVTEIGVPGVSGYNDGIIATITYGDSFAAQDI